MGRIVGDRVGCRVGEIVGGIDEYGTYVGLIVGRNDGIEVGALLGADGTTVGLVVGEIDGLTVGEYVGVTVGISVHMGTVVVFVITVDKH